MISAHKTSLKVNEYTEKLHSEKMEIIHHYVKIPTVPWDHPAMHDWMLRKRHRKVDGR